MTTFPCNTPPHHLCRVLRHHRTLLLGLKVRNHLLSKEANGVEHLLVLRRPNSTEQKHLLNTQRFIPFEKPDAVRWRADAE
jgi:hypothetical protein